LILQDRGVDGSIFQTPRKLHLTLGTLVLLTETDVTQATQLLEDCHAELTQLGTILFFRKPQTLFIVLSICF